MNLLLADDHTLFRQGLSLIIEEIFPFSRLQYSDCWTDVHQITSQQHFELVLLDLFMPRQYSWEQELEYLLINNPHLIICVISASTEMEDIQATFKLGVKGYICKMAETNELQRALLQVYAGKNYFPVQMWPDINNNKNIYNKLTLRQHDILKLLSRGYCNKMIAKKRGITENTVKRHLYNIFQILKAKNRVEAIEIARQQCLLHQPY